MRFFTWPIKSAEMFLPKCGISGLKVSFFELMAAFSICFAVNLLRATIQAIRSFGKALSLVDIVNKLTVS